MSFNHVGHMRGFRKDGSIDTCPDRRICHLSFDWRTKALVSNDHHDCSAFHAPYSLGRVVMLAGCSSLICWRNTYVYYPTYHVFYTVCCIVDTHVEPVCPILLDYSSDKVLVDTLCPVMYSMRLMAEASNAAVRQEKLCHSHTLYLAAALMCMT